MMRAFAICLAVCLASAGHAQWCAQPIYGLADAPQVAVQAIPGIPAVYATDYSKDPLVFQQLDQDRFVPVERPLFVPKGLNYLLRLIPEQNGSVNFNRIIERDGRESVTALYRVTADGVLQEVLKTRLRAPWADPETGRIFAFQDYTLMEYVNGAFVVSPLWPLERPLDKGFKEFLRPRFVPALDAWIVVSEDALWMRGANDDAWRKVTRIKTWRDRLAAWEMNVFHDLDRELLVVQVDVSALVFDVSGAKPVYLYQRVFRGLRPAQAGSGGILIEPYRPSKDIGWFERAAMTRVLTKDGAQPIAGAAIVDGRTPPKRNYYKVFNPLVDLGEAVLVFHANGVAQFDGARLIDRPDLAVRFPGFPPLVHKTKTGVYLERDGVNQWGADGTLTPMVSPDGNPARTVQGGHDFSFFKAGELGFVIDEAGAAWALPPPAGANKPKAIIPVPFRTQLIAEYEGERVLYAPCGAGD